MGFRVMSRYRVDASISGGCVRVILMELQCSPFSVIQDQHSRFASELIGCSGHGEAAACPP